MLLEAAATTCPGPLQTPPTTTPPIPSTTRPQEPCRQTSPCPSLQMPGPSISTPTSLCCPTPVSNAQCTAGKILHHHCCMSQDTFSELGCIFLRIKSRRIHLLAFLAIFPMKNQIIGKCFSMSSCRVQGNRPAQAHELPYPALLTRTLATLYKSITSISSDGARQLYITGCGPAYSRMPCSCIVLQLHESFNCFQAHGCEQQAKQAATADCSSMSPHKDYSRA